MAVMDGAIANVALPTIAKDLNASPAFSIWIVNGYQLAITISLLPLASLGEIIGYRRVYLAGLLLFTLASLFCVLAHALLLLTVARILQGFGAAGIMSVNMALVRYISSQERCPKIEVDCPPQKARPLSQTSTTPLNGRNRRGADENPPGVILLVAGGSITSALRQLRMAKILDPYGETERMTLEPWLIEAALARLDRTLKSRRTTHCRLRPLAIPIKSGGRIGGANIPNPIELLPSRPVGFSNQIDALQRLCRLL